MILRIGGNVATSRYGKFRCTVFGIIFILIGGILLAQDHSDLEEEIFGTAVEDETQGDNSELEEDLFGSPDSDDSSTLGEDLFGSSDPGNSSLEDELFGTGGGDDQGSESESGSFVDDMVQEVDSDSGSAPEDAFLVTEDVTLGGSFYADMAVKGYWLEYPESGDEDAWGTFWDLAQNGIVPALSGQLYFDARPWRDFRVFGKAKMGLPLTNSYYLNYVGTGEDGFPSGDDTAETVIINSPNIQLFELYADFTWGDIAFFRIGKQTINWGTGYFWSPGDILNLEPINPDDPEAEREGPISFKLQIPFYAHNFYCYLIVPSDIESITELGIAPKFEFVVSTFEFTLGGFYRKGVTPQITASFTGSVLDFDIFAEGALGIRANDRGNDRYYVAEDGTVQVNDSPVNFSGTLGFSYSYPDLNLSILAQYYYTMNGYKYNGDSYYLTDENYGTDPDALQPDYLSLLYTQMLMGNVGYKDVAYIGRHYGAVSISFSNIAESNVGISGTWMGNLQDWSGLFSVNLSYAPMQYFRIKAGVSAAYGQDGDEYIGTRIMDQFVGSLVNPYGRLAFTLGINLGSGSF